MAQENQSWVPFNPKLDAKFKIILVGTVDLSHIEAFVFLAQLFPDGGQSFAVAAPWRVEFYEPGFSVIDLKGWGIIDIFFHVLQSKGRRINIRKNLLNFFRLNNREQNKEP